MSTTSAKPIVRKVVCYVVQSDHLLAFTHEEVPIEVVGVQVPAGTIEPGESPAEAAVREVLEETGLDTLVVRFLGRGRYDISPARREIADRHFFQLAPTGSIDVSSRWSAGDASPSDGRGRTPEWTCWWLPIEHAHVLAAGLGALVGAMYEAPFRRRWDVSHADDPSRASRSPSEVPGVAE